MKACLVRPYSETFVVSPPFGLGYLASAARLAGHDVAIVDGLLVGGSLRQHLANTIEAIGASEPGVIGVQAFSCDFFIVGQLLDAIRGAFPEALLILGGAHPSGVRAGIFNQFPQIDFAMAGEGEMGFAMWLDEMEKPDRSQASLTDIPGLIYRTPDGRVTVNQVSAEEDLDQWGQPAWDLMDPRIYPKAPHQGVVKGFPVAPIIATRGCPFKCTFCSVLTVTGRKPRYRDVTKVVDEIELLVNQYGVKEIHIQDDIFTLSKRFVMGFVDEVKRRGVKFHWFCSSGVRLGSLDEELIRAMDEVGCYTYTLAIESGSDKILKDMDKRLTTAETREKVALLNRMGHKPSAFFIIGFPTERREDVLETLRFAMSLKLRRAHFSIFYPLPGSIEYERLKETGELEELDWSKLKSEKVAFRHKHMSARELRFLQRYAFLRFHLRPRILLTNLWEILNSGNFWFIARRVWVYLVGSGGAGWPGRSSDALRGDAGH